MGYLGLDQTEIKEDNLFQRLFWPGDHAGETDALGKQGFWICMAVAVLSLAVLAIQGYLFLAILQFVFFALGGIGVREHSVASAVLVAVSFWVNQIVGAMTGHLPGFLWIAAGVILIANIRGTYIAARWARKGDADVFLERRSGTLREKFSDQMPAKTWRTMKYPFYAISGIYMVVLLLGAVGTVAGLQARKPVGDGQRLQTIEVAPPR